MKKALLLVALMLIAVPFKAMTETPRSDTYRCSRTEAAEGVTIQPATPASAPLQRPYRYGPDHRTNILI